MSLKIKNKFISEDIIDENGNKLGVLKFNPNDSRIMEILSNVVNDYSDAIKEINKLGKIEDMSTIEFETSEDFEKISENLKKINKGYDIEASCADKLINGLSEIFGKETVELFTGGTKDAESLLPIIEFIAPYIEKSRKSKTKKYLKNTNKANDVME